MTKGRFLILLAMVGAAAFLVFWTMSQASPEEKHLISKVSFLYIFVTFAYILWRASRRFDEMTRRYSAQLALVSEQKRRAEARNEAFTSGSQSAIQNSDAAMIRIRGATFVRLQRAIKAFPGKYPGYQTKPPKLDGDVRPWLDDSGFVRDGAKGREAIVFGRIISEHFGFSPDTQKSQ